MIDGVKGFPAIMEDSLPVVIDITQVSEDLIITTVNLLLIFEH